MSGYEGRYLNHAKSKMVGNTFGRLIVIDIHGRNKHGSYEWKCLCSCGNECVVSTNSLNMGNTKSCGCLLADTTREVHSTHGLSDHPLYKVMEAMKRRCYSQEDKGYVNYGKRRIQICSDWRYNFNSFYDWSISNGYQEGLTIERNNNDGNYEPGNCRWTTQQEQNQNKRNVILSAEDVLKIRSDFRSDDEIAQDYSVDPHTIYCARTRRTWNNIE